MAPVRVTLGELTRLTGRYQEAILEYQRALDLDPTSFDAYNGLAAAYLALGKFDEAVAIHRRAIGLRPDYWKGHYNLAVSYLERGRDAEAEPLFRRATELAPDHAVAHSSLGAILIRLGRYPEAQKELEVSLGLKPNPFGYNNLSIVLSFQGRFADAVHAMEKAVELGGEDGYRVGNLAGTYRWAGDLAKAGAAYQKAAELVERELAASPNNAFLHAILANYSAYLDRREQARAEIERARQLEGANVSVLLQSLIVYERLGNRDRSWEPLAAIVKQNRSMNQLYAHPDLAALRLDPRFKAVVNNLHQ
ncbi:MAG: tetratricopeptide repeat protein [Acidobacteria bacterium]|nr:tetratricopeptide repeat protein [Acidobacteriota bacterium]